MPTSKRKACQAQARSRDSEPRSSFHPFQVAESGGFGLVLFEAMACGKPMVTTELGTGASWINQHGETGFVVPPSDAGALAEAIRRLASDEPLRRTMGQAAYDRVCKVFTRREFGESYVQLFKELLAGAPPIPKRLPAH
jgi:glycosyltransferase involved in cell wall biosynthesis